MSNAPVIKIESPQSIGRHLARRGRIPQAISAEDLIPNTDITAALQAMIDAYDSVSITRPGTYYLSIAGADPYVVSAASYSLLIAKNNFHIHIGDGVTLKLSDNEQEDTDGYYAMFLFQHRSNLTFSGNGTLDSNSQGQSAWTGGYAQNGGFHILGRAKVAGTGCNNIHVNDLTMKNTFGNPVNIGQTILSENIYVINCKFFTFGEGPQFVRCKNVKVLGNILRDDTGKSQGDGFEFAACEQVTCSNNFLSTTSVVGGTAFDLYGSVDVVVSGNNVDGWLTGIISFGFPPGLSRTRNVTVVGNTFRGGNIGFANVDAMTVTFANNVWIDNTQPFFLSMGPFTGVTITSSGTTATVTQASHTYITGDTVRISGANEPAYNGRFSITVTSVNAYTYTMASGASSPATGTIVSRSAFNVVKISGDVFRQCGTSTINGKGDLEIMDCTFDKCGPNVCVNITAGNAPAVTDRPTFRMSRTTFLECDASPIQVTAIQDGVDFAPDIVLKDNDFLETDSPPILLFFPNALLSNLTGSGNRGYTIPSETFNNQLAEYVLTIPTVDYHDGATLWFNAGVLTRSSAPTYSGLISSLVAFWEMQEAIGSVSIADSSGNGHTGGLQNEPVFEKAGPNAWLPRGIDIAIGAFDCGDIAALDVGTGGLTICGWVRNTDLASQQCVIGKTSNATGQNHFRAILRAGGGLGLLYGNDGEVYSAQSAAMTVNTWQFCAWGRNPATGKSFVYLDGTLSEISENISQPLTNAEQVVIGRDSQGGYKCTAWLSGLMLFNRALNLEQLELLRTDGPVIPLLLDGYTGVTSALSGSRRLLSSYTGPILTLRRGGDNVELEFGYDMGNDVDAAAIAAWSVAGGGDGSAFIKIIHDQSGNGRNLVESTAGLQPVICTAGTVFLLGAKPTGVFEFDKGLKIGVYGTLLVQSFSVLQSSTSPTWIGYHAICDRGNGVDASRRGGLAILGNDGLEDSNGPLAVWQNGTSLTPSVSCYTAINSPFQTTINHRLPTTTLDNLSVGNFDGGATGGSARQSELITFDVELSSGQRAAIEADQIAYYGITP